MRSPLVKRSITRYLRFVRSSRHRVLLLPAALLAVGSACSTLEGLSDLQIDDGQGARDAEQEDVATGDVVSDGRPGSEDAPSEDAPIDTTAEGATDARLADATGSDDALLGSDTDSAPPLDAGDAGFDAQADADDGSALLDASDASDASDAAPADAGDADARTCTSLTVVQNDTLVGPQNTHWVLGEKAFFTRTPPSTYYCELTTATTSIQGSLWWNDLFTFDAFDLTFSFLINSNGNYADGLGFGWIPEVTPIATPGFGGNTYGMAGLGGYGVVIDTYQNTGEPSAPFFAVIANDSTGTHLVNTPVPAVLGGSTFHTMHVTFAAPSISVTIDGTPVVTSFAIPNYVPFVGRWAFFAANGGFAEQSLVTGITMIFPNGTCSP